MDNLDRSEAFWRDVVAWLALAAVVACVVAAAASVAHWSYVGFR